MRLTTRRNRVPFILSLAVIPLAIVITGLMVTLKTNATNPVSLQVELVTVNESGTGGLSSNSYVHGVSGDGDKILFTTAARDLQGFIPWDNPNGAWLTAYIKTMSTGAVYRVGKSDSNQPAHTAVMNTTGRYVAFVSNATDFASDEPIPTGSKILLQDTVTSKVELIATMTSPHPSWLFPVSISDDGRFVVVKTRGSGVNDVLPNTRPSTQNVSDVLLYDRTTKAWTILNKNVDGTLPNVNSVAGNSSCDAAYVLFSSTATSLTDDFTGSGQHLYMVDIRNGLKVTDLTPGATGNSVNGKISCNGRYVSYDTEDRTLISPQPQNYPVYKYPGPVQLARYDRFTGARQYLSKAENNTKYSLLPISMISTPSNAGDAVITYSSTGSSNIFDANLVLKKAGPTGALSDPINLSPLPNALFKARDITFELSSDGRYVFATTELPTSIGQPASTSSSDRKDIFRIKIN